MLQNTPAVKVMEEVGSVTFNPTAIRNSCPARTRQKLFNKQSDFSRKPDLTVARRTPGTKGRPVRRRGKEEETERGLFQHIEDLEKNREDLSELDPLNPGSSQTARRELCSTKAGRNGLCGVPAVCSSPSQTSAISDAAAEELCDLRSYYSKQLQKINNVSLEQLERPVEAGVLSCIREPLRSLRLPRRAAIAQRACSLWSRVGSRRKLVGRWEHPP